jgi:DNA repair protein RadC
LPVLKSNIRQLKNGLPFSLITSTIFFPMDKAHLDLIAVTEIEIKYKNKVKSSERPKITGSHDAERIFRPIFSEFIEHHEAMYAMYLNRANKVLGCLQIGVGGIAGVAADAKIIFQGALKANASGIILAHNHPSGNKTASQADIDLTRKIKEAGKFLEIALLDHLIMLPEEVYFSFADEGML